MKIIACLLVIVMLAGYVPDVFADVFTFTDPLQEQAESDAKRDARSDINTDFWELWGGGLICLGMGIGTCVGVSIGGKVVNEQYFSFSDLDDALAVLVGSSAIGCMIGVAVPTFFISIYKGHVPTQRLMGKSPEYVEFYTQAYQKEASSLRTTSALLGLRRRD